MDWLEDVLEEIEHKLYSAFENRYCNAFSDFIAFLPTVKKVFHRKIADIDNLVNGTQGSQVALIVEEMMKDKHNALRLCPTSYTSAAEVQQAIQGVCDRT